MIKNLKKIGNYYIVIKIFVLFISIMLCTAFITMHFIMKKSQSFLDHLENTAKMVIVNINQNKRLPYVGNTFKVFVIDVKEGFAIYDRPSDSYEDKVLWESYRTKLIYQMQKEKNGWIFYPEKGKWNFTKDIKAIRYLSINDLGWIVVAEGLKKSELSLAKELLSPSLFIFIAAIFLAGAGLIGFYTKRHHVILKKSITDMLENGLMNINTNSFFKDTDISHASKSDGIFHSNRPIEAPAEEHVADISDPKAFQPQIKKITTRDEVKGQKPSILNEFEKNEKSNTSSKAVKKEKKAVDDSQLDDLTIEIQGIKSPLLKQMIKEIRER